MVADLLSFAWVKSFLDNNARFPSHKESTAEVLPPREEIRSGRRRSDFLVENSIDGRTIEDVVEVAPLGMIYGSTMSWSTPQPPPGIEMSVTAFLLHTSFLLERGRTLYKMHVFLFCVIPGL